MTLNELHSWLESQGFTFARYFTREERNTCEWYAQRGQIVVKPYATQYTTAVSVEIRGEKDGLPLVVAVPQIMPDELTERLPEIEALLARGANAMMQPALGDAAAERKG